VLASELEDHTYIRRRRETKHRLSKVFGHPKLFKTLLATFVVAQSIGMMKRTRDLGALINLRASKRGLKVCVLQFFGL
jgi:hypothetical protein